MAKKQDTDPEASPETEDLAMEPEVAADPVAEVQPEPGGAVQEKEAGEEAEPEPENHPELPESVTVASYYGFYDDEGNGRFWSEGQVVTEPADIELLLERDAPLKD